MNSNLFHNILNAAGLIVGSLAMIDWTTLGVDPLLAGQIASIVLILNNSIKLGVNISRDGFSGLAKDQPPVKK